MSLVSESADLARPLRPALSRAEPRPVEPSLVQPSLASVGDYLALLKPRVMSLVVFTALVGMLVAPGHIHPFIGFTALLCIAIGAGASGALNMWYDADIDAVMTRTAKRPIPAGRIEPGEALAFGATLAVFSVAVLGVLVDWFAAALLAFTIFFYVFVYTMWLKRATPQNIVIGGAAGAFPPVVGWSAVTGDVSLAPLLMFLVIFLWTPPHFWALSLLRCDDYARAKVPMLPVVAGTAATRRQILIYTLILAPAGLAPWVAGFAGLLYGVVALVCGLVMLHLSWRVYRDRTGPAAAAAARRLFAFSLLYVFALFAALAADNLLARLGLAL
jgi:heme o synthase